MPGWDRCPGQSTQFWKPGDIFNVPCPACGAAVEFWKDELRRPCPACKTLINNPRHDAGCASWCEHADACLGRKTEE